ncbi:MAG: T9SS type A sorting domain-containing protein [Bacteroidales bacterium]|nr:T9SS type A sorting domain-containing protein [Bacteroidales bacterium]
MKKHLILLSLLLAIAGMTWAQDTPQHGWHTYCQGEFNNAIGGPVPFITATCYSGDLVAEYAGTSITKVAIYSDTLYNAVGGTYTCTVYVGGDSPYEGLEVSSITVEVPQSLGDWVEFDLETPVVVTGNVPIWIVWVCTHQLGICPMGVCEGNDPSGDGHWIWQGPFAGWEQSQYGDWTVKTYFDWDGPQPQPQDVYVSGNHFTTGKVLKNNTLLYSITDSIDVQLRGIQVVEDGTVYGTGYAYDSSDVYGYVWMNDSCIFVADTNTTFEHIALNGNDWTVAGFNSVWQNGELLYSYTHGDNECHIQGLAVDTTGDIYAGGAIFLDSVNLAHASVWKNDSLLWMEDNVSSIESICFDGENLYATGFMVVNDSLSYGVIWQNDSIIYQMENANFGFIAVFDSSLYWTGISLTDTIVYIWQDGEVLYALPELSGISNLIVNESGVYYTDAQTVYKDGEVLYEPEECIISDLVVKPAPTPPEYTITLESANPEMGIVDGGGTYPSGSTVTIVAIPELGCEFLGWNDSITDNPREIVVTQDSTFVASFGLIEYTINVVSDHPGWGSVSGGGTYHYGDTVQIEATPYLGFEFVRWQDSNTDNPRTIVVTQNRTYTATFRVQQCLIKTEVTPEGAGTVSGGGTYDYGATIHLTAHSNTGYVFSMWEDGNITNPRTVFVEGNATYTAVFSPLPYEITTECDPVEGGTVSGAGTYYYGSTATLTATPNENYIFLCWSDGIASNPRNVLVTGNANYKAMFYLQGTPQYTITVLPNDPALGTVTGGGTYPQGSTIEISATPFENVAFRGWDDGNTDNPRSITVNSNMTFTALFEAIQPGETYTITVRSENPLMGTVYGSGTYPVNTIINIGASPNQGFYFSGWQDGDMNNPRTITVTGDAEYIASFSTNPTVTYTVTVYYDETQGFIIGAGTYNAGATASLAAIPADGYYFKKWGDGNTDNPREILVDHDIVLAAFFEGTGVDEEGFENVSLYPNPANDKIRIEGLEGEHEISIYNAMGMKVMAVTLQDEGEIHIDELSAGLYLLRIDEKHTMRFVKR